MRKLRQAIEVRGFPGLRIETGGTHRSCVRRGTLLAAILLCSISSVCIGEARDVVCDGGFGAFSSKLKNGVTVTVGAQKEAGFASHACQAKITWNQNELTVAHDAAQVDIDVLGADLGLGTPMVAFQFKNSYGDARMNYAVYSLDATPRPLRTLSDGDFYSAADTDMDGRVEIWTGDAKAANGFEGVPLADFDFAPPVVLRFEQGRLMDVSAEFTSYYDKLIAQVRAGLDPQGLVDFKESDGRPMTRITMPMDALRRLVKTKIKVLEIVWCYLNSGREQDAWKALAETWPAEDVDRIRTAILDAQARGIRSEIDGVSTSASTLRKKPHAEIFDFVKMENSQIAPQMIGSGRRGAPSISGTSMPSSIPPNVTRPEAIHLFTPQLEEGQSFPEFGLSMDLTLDAAGKVRSAKMTENVEHGPVVDGLLSAAADWKFTPATRDGKPMACSFRLTVSPTR